MFGPHTGDAWERPADSRSSRRLRSAPHRMRSRSPNGGHLDQRELLVLIVGGEQRMTPTVVLVPLREQTGGRREICLLERPDDVSRHTRTVRRSPAADTRFSLCRSHTGTPFGCSAPILETKQHNDAGWSSSVARWAHNPEVAGSNPAPATRRRRPGPDGPGLRFVTWVWSAASHDCRLTSPRMTARPRNARPTSTAGLRCWRGRAFEHVFGGGAGGPGGRACPGCGCRARSQRGQGVGAGDRGGSRHRQDPPGGVRRR